MKLASSDRDPWVAPTGTRIPDFIIAGAMKCGTSTVHTILDSHPKVTIPVEEVHFFDIDDALEHEDFVFRAGEDWRWPDPDIDPEPYWAWYAQQFSHASDDDLIGEDSTGYLPSRHAFERIARQDKPIKIIICLRHPTSRAYSHYYHLLRTGRAVFNFEQTLQYLPQQILGRGHYEDQIRKLFEVIPRENVFIFIFEEYLQDKEGTIRDMCGFLDLDFDQLPDGWADTHSNAGRIPRFPALQAFRNWAIRRASSGRYSDHFPIHEFQTTGSSEWRIPMPVRILNRLHMTVNPLVNRKPPKMSGKTRAYLDSYYRKRLKGLDDLVGRPVLGNWFQD